MLCFIGSGVSMAQEVSIIAGRITQVDGRALSDAAVRCGRFGGVSDASGYFSFGFRGDATQGILEVSHVAFAEVFVALAEGVMRSDTLYFEEVRLSLKSTVISEVTLEERRKTAEQVIKLKPQTLEVIPGPTATVEGLIKTLPGVMSNNELSSQYSVRGGNFDENLVYINGIEVYRPFLVRSGQQEGLSVINSDLIQQISFSSGGFAARYGDKMSSVLDITYKRPQSFFATINGNLLGTSISVGDRSESKKFRYLGSFRYRTNQLVLGALDTDADFRPRYTDFQSLLEWELAPRWYVSALGLYSRNIFEIIPETRTTEFGTVQEALQLTVFFDGREVNQYETGFGALSLRHHLTDQTVLHFTMSGFQTQEVESFDVIGQYRLGELENNLGSETFGEVIYERGAGEYINYARNRLFASVVNLQHRGVFNSVDDETHLHWGVKIQREAIADRLDEWIYIDSVGYSIPQNSDEQLDVDERIRADAELIRNRATAYVQWDQTESVGPATLQWNAGVRTSYGSINEQLLLSPRISIRLNHDSLPDWDFRLSGGVYYQPPFYRELRNLTGELNTAVRAQKSVHLVAGATRNFDAWGRPFQFSAEAYYKWLSDLVPYQMENVRLRYFAENSASGYATGLDFRLNGEFVPGVESWASLSVMTIQEDLNNDSYVNADGDVVSPGYIPKPTDQRVGFSIFFQDHLPNDPSFKVNLTVFLGTGLPFGAPESERYQQIYRMPAYRRVDIGFTKTLLAPDRFGAEMDAPTIKHLWVGLEVFNLLAIRNTINYLWVKDVSGGSIAVPNYLTNRLLNLKLVMNL